MHISKEQVEEYCKKPAVTFHCRGEHTLSVAVVALISLIVLMHLCMCKMSACRKNKIKNLKCKVKEAKAEAEE